MIRTDPSMNSFLDVTHLLAKLDTRLQDVPSDLKKFIEEQQPEIFGEETAFNKPVAFFVSERTGQAFFLLGPGKENRVIKKEIDLNKQQQLTAKRGAGDIRVSPTLTGNENDPDLAFVIEEINAETREGIHYRKEIVTAGGDTIHIVCDEKSMFHQQEQTITLSAAENIPLLSGDMAAAAQPQPWLTGWFEKDWLATNDLIHPPFTVQLAKSAIGSETNRDKQVEMIGKYIKANLQYKSVGAMLSDYNIWNAGKTGVCLEYATLYHSMLRSIGIPTRMVFLAGMRNGSFSWSHAVIEYWNQRWVHADALWGLRDNPGFYKKTVSGPPITIMEGHLMGFPVDKTPPANDGKLSAWPDWDYHFGATALNPYNP